MNLALYIYLCDVVGNIGWMFGALFLIGLIASFFTGLAFFPVFGEGSAEDQKLWCRFAKAIFPSTVIVSLFFAAIPSQKTMYAMAAAYYGEQAVKSETFQRLNGKAMQLLEVKIDELIGETKK